MEMYLKQKVFSLKDKFNVYDVNENPLYTVEGKMISLHHKHFIYDGAGQQVAYIHQKVVALMPKFFIELANGKTYELKDKLAFAHEVAVIKELGWKIKGKFLEHDYAFTKDDVEIAAVHQKWLSWGDTYEISVSEGVDEVLVLAIVLCFDIMHEESAAATTTATSAAISAANNNNG